ncbi:MAG: hypothetical protein EOO73_21345 [Myxococcales bacterium]|nr:MAG: hypothetical protein EOO73_21345 [Myxococcales bacterium]
MRQEAVRSGNLQVGAVGTPLRSTLQAPAEVPLADIVVGGVHGQDGHGGKTGTAARRARR